VAKQQNPNPTQQDLNRNALARLQATVEWIDRQLVESRISIRRGQITKNNGASWEPSDWLDTLIQVTQELAGVKAPEPEIAPEPIADTMGQIEEWKPAE
jgi:hypothetical protein